MSSQNVKVVVRCRPILPRERLKGHSRDLFKFQGNSLLLVLENAENSSQFTQNVEFSFDHVFQPANTCEEVYKVCGEPLIQQFLKGFNATILAYGQTGSGKTWTMGTGLPLENVSPEDIPLVPRCIETLFNLLDSQDSLHFKFQLEVSFLELYQEELIDLLNPTSKRLSLGLHPLTGQPFVSNLSQIPCSNTQQIMQLLRRGSLVRSTGSTEMNSSSSRSHAVFTLHLSQERCEDGVWHHSTSKLHFVDLAGSERLKKTLATGVRQREGININQGLFALGNVISALTSEERRHVPYRDSKLTRLLQDSLGGNSYCIMLACVSPFEGDAGETWNTLRYAERARKIQNHVTLNQILVDDVQILKQQIQILSKKLQNCKCGEKEIVEESELNLKREVEQQRALVRQLSARVEDLEQGDGYGDDVVVEGAEKLREKSSIDPTSLYSLLSSVQQEVKSKESLLQHLESQKREYDLREKKYMEKLSEMMKSLESLEKQRDETLKSQKEKPGTLAIKKRYETQIEKLSREISDYKKKYQDAMKTVSTSKQQNLILVKGLKNNIQLLKNDKLKMLRQLKDEMARLKELEVDRERLSKMVKTLDVKAKKLEKKSMGKNVKEEVEKVAREAFDDLAKQEIEMEETRPEIRQEPIELKKHILDNEVENWLSCHQQENLRHHLTNQLEGLKEEIAQTTVILHQAKEQDPMDLDYVATIEEQLEILQTESKILNSKLNEIPRHDVVGLQDIDRVLSTFSNVDHVEISKMLIQDVLLAKLHQRTSEQRLKDLEQETRELRRQAMIITKAAQQSSLEYEEQIQDLKDRWIPRIEEEVEKVEDEMEVDEQTGQDGITKFVQILQEPTTQKPSLNHLTNLIGNDVVQTLSPKRRREDEVFERLASTHTAASAARFGFEKS